METSGDSKPGWPRPLWLFYVLAVSLLIADQWTKSLILDHFYIGQVRPVIEGILNWTYVTNDGVAFGLFQGNNLLLGMVAGSILVFGFWISRSLDWKSIEVNFVGAMIVSGAVGNLIDRILHGYVVDFIDVYYQDWHWPSFNIADSCISLSMVWIIGRTIVDTFRDRQELKAN
ncbi:MAG: signal peptidase II [Verrucomicrobiota bacterium]